MIGGPPGHHDEVINYLMINTLIHWLIIINVQVPSSESNVSVTEFISSDLLPPLPHGKHYYSNVINSDRAEQLT